jgi:hypothetical protein
MVVTHIGHIFLLLLIYAFISSFRIPSGAFIVASGCMMGTGFPARLISDPVGLDLNATGPVTKLTTNLAKKQVLIFSQKCLDIRCYLTFRLQPQFPGSHSYAVRRGLDITDRLTSTDARFAGRRSTGERWMDP